MVPAAVPHVSQRTAQAGHLIMLRTPNLDRVAAFPRARMRQVAQRSRRTALL